MADDEEVLANCARRLIPFMLLLYITSYIDRVNVGFAAPDYEQGLGLFTRHIWIWRGRLFRRLFPATPAQMLIPHISV
jgi:ACS family tartrate transporter-like MFS transporter